MMKVVHFVTERSFRGGERQIYYLAKELKNHNVESLIVCREESPFPSEEFQNLKVKSFSPFHILSLIRTLNYLKHKKIDIIHAHSSKGHTFGLLIKILGFKGKFILTRRVSFAISKGLLTQRKYNSPHLDGIVAISKYISRQIKNSTSVKSEIPVIYSAANSSLQTEISQGLLFKDFNIEIGTRIIGYTSALDPDKDPLTFIKTAEHYSKTYPNGNIRWILFGEGSMKRELQKYIQTKNLSDKVILAGFSHKLNNYFADFDVFVMPSLMEGLGTSILESYWAGVPPIGTKAGGIPEIILDKKTGFIHNKGDFKSIAESIRLLLTNGELYKAMVTDGKEFVKSFEVSKMAKSYLEQYQNL